MFRIRTCKRLHHWMLMVIFFILLLLLLFLSLLSNHYFRFSMCVSSFFFYTFHFLFLHHLVFASFSKKKERKYLFIYFNSFLFCSCLFLQPPVYILMCALVFVFLPLCSSCVVQRVRSACLGPFSCFVGLFRAS